MDNKKLFRILRLLSERELDNFGEFLDSPYHNKNVKFRRLWTVLKQFAPNFDAKNMGNHSNFVQICPKPSKLNSMLGKLTILLEYFLTLERFRTDQFYRKHLLLNEFLRIKAMPEFEKLHNSVMKLIERETVRGKDFYYRKYLIGYDYLEYLTQSHANLTSIVAPLERTLADLDTCYILPKLILSGELENLKRLTNKEKANSKLLPAIDLALESGWLSDIAAVRIQYLSTRVVLYSEVADFEALLVLLDEYVAEVPKIEQYPAYMIAINFCIKMLREQKSYYWPLFSLYEKLIIHQILTSSGYLSPSHLKNMVTVGCRLKQFDQTRRLIEDLKDQMPPDFIASAYHFYLGVLAYRQGNCNEALDQLLLAEAPDKNGKTAFNIDVRSVRLKIYYQTLPDKLSLLTSLLKSFRELVRKSKLGNELNESYRNFCTILAQMADLKTNPNSKHSTTSINKNLEGFERVADKSWLLEEIRKLGPEVA